MKTSLTYIPRQKAVKSTFNVAKCSQEFEARGDWNLSRTGCGFAHPVKPYLRLVVATELGHYPPHITIAQRDFLEEYVTM